ncbi:EAL domain-containing protein [Henriciella marina]|uniref:EAL domain-containing protein n=1 Tax=Henriciella marina TaxID=453851 RepID=UPI0003644E05|nr:EAL domain-containing protein [Henriciella marina]
MITADPLTLGEWTWNAQSQRLSIRVDAATDFQEIDGTWTLQSVSKILDGLSHQRLHKLFTGHRPDAERVSCRLELSTGKVVSLTGAFDGAGSAEGVLMRRIETGEWFADPAGAELEAVFQPIVSLKSGRIDGFEALARWPSADASRPDGRQERGLATSMLMRASESLAAWMMASGRRDLFVNVNVTAPDLAEDALVTLVGDLISGHAFSDGQLRIELTEQAALRDPDAVLKTVEALRDVGAGIILDDFGTGHSSFEWLEALPADGLKVDADLIAKLDRSRMQTILKAVTTLAHELGMSRTAEGVEDLGRISLLKELGFDYVQGFAFSKPLPAREAGELLKA